MPWLETTDLRRHYRRAGHQVRALDGVGLATGGRRLDTPSRRQEMPSGLHLMPDEEHPVPDGDGRTRATVHYEYPKGPPP